MPLYPVITMSNFYIPKLASFQQLVYNISTGEYINLQYLPAFLELYIKYSKYLEDDFSVFNENRILGALSFLVNVSPHCYLVTDEEETLCGFFALENLRGTEQKPFSAEVVTCFDRKYWGKFTKFTALIFRDYCFNTLKLKKLKAVIYPQNKWVKALLRESGFQLEAKLNSETAKDGKYQDVEIYSIIK